MKKDLIVIGSGPGGYTAAIRAAQLGAGVALIEARRVGGICLNWGCIPTKALYQNAHLVKNIKEAGVFGITTAVLSLDFAQMQKRKREIIASLADGINKLIKANQIEFVLGKASLVGRNTVRVVGENKKACEIRGGNILLATGSIPVRPSICGIDLPGVLNNEELLEVEEIPDSMIIIGGGAIGIEFAGIFSALGSRITILEKLPRILSGIDSEISRRLVMSFKKKGILIETGVNVKEIVRDKGRLQVKAENNKGALLFEAGKVFVSTGRVPNTDGLNLEEVGVEYNSGGIQVNEKYATSVPGIFAVGDSIGGKMLAHVASQEGITVVENMMGIQGQVNYKAVPECVFTFPEIAAVGLTEEDVRKKEIPYITGRYMFSANGKALTMGETEGLVKVIAKKDTRELIGVHIIGPHASDLIHEASLALTHKMKVEDIYRAIHAHPTLAECFQEAVMGLDDRAIHLIKRTKKETTEV